MSTRRSILLADDDDEVRLGVADLLDGMGLAVHEVGSGLEAVELCRRVPVDAALLDWHMPGCTGFEALPQLRRERQGLACILYSGELTAEMERTALAVGALSVLRKPVDPRTLRDEVERALALFPFFPEPTGSSGSIN